MHNHGNNNGNGGHDSKMMWLMMLGCMLPILILVFTGGGAGRSAIWLVLLVVGGMLAMHWFMMRGHSNHGHEDNTSVGTVGNQTAIPPATSQASSGPPQPTADSSATKGEHKHDDS